MKHASHTYNTLSQWAEVPDDYTPLYVATDKPAQGSIIPLQTISPKPERSPRRTKKTRQQSLQELRECKEDCQLVWVYVYKCTEIGYFALYEGVSCYIPHFPGACKYLAPGDEQILVGTWCQAKVRGIDEINRVSLSIKNHLKTQFLLQSPRRAQHLQPGIPFNGVVKRVYDNCILLLGNQLHGRLEMDEVISKHLLALRPELEQRHKILRSIFLQDKPITAIIKSISANGVVTLPWDKKLPANAAICDAICQMGIRC